MELVNGFFRWLSRRSGVARLSLAGGCAALATVLALPLRDRSTTTTVPALIYILGVVVAAVVGGIRGGLAASFLSFLGLNFFFTPPFYTFEVEKPEDIVALVVFLIVSTVVANLFTQLQRQRERAASRETETRVLYQMASRLLGAGSQKRVLEDFARELSDLLHLSRCEVYISNGEGPAKMIAGFSEPASWNGSHLDLPLRTDRMELGFVRMSPKAENVIDARHREVAEAFVSQVAMAIESLKLHEQTQAAQAQAETSRVRAALFSSVTHDLRTPLSSIKAAATSLLEEGVSFEEPQRIDLLKTIAEESDRLNRLIGNLLDLSRLRAGAFRPEKLPTPIEDVIEAVSWRFRKLDPDREIHVKIRQPIPPVAIDVLQIDQVLTNLLENAVRYSPTGTKIEIGARKWQHSVEVEVADGGPGIKGDERNKAFEEFFRGKASSRFAGSGLGLTIARAIVEGHGGSMWIHETPGGGATVGFRLPIGASDR